MNTLRFGYSLAFLVSSGIMAHPALGADIETDARPPPPRVEHPPPPRDGYVWGPGYWAWSGKSYDWVGGSWVVQRRHKHWVADQWEHAGDKWHFVPGHWEES